jgi:hypothetical protein
MQTVTAGLPGVFLLLHRHPLSWTPNDYVDHLFVLLPMYVRGRDRFYYDFHARRRSRHGVRKTGTLQGELY